MKLSWPACVPLLLSALAGLGAPTSRAEPIDRQALVSRHSPVAHAISPGSAFSVGNGGFAFTCDITGLQSLEPAYFAGGFPLETMARWAWHEQPNPNHYTLADASEIIPTQGRPVAYPTRASTPAGDWLRKNPQDFPVGQLSFVDAAGAPLAAADIAAVDQTLDLWRGEIHSRFTWRGEPVEVSTICHPVLDMIAVRVQSRALADGRLRVRLAFPRGHDIAVKNSPPLDWSHPETHGTRVVARTATRADFERTRDALRYYAALLWSEGASLEAGASPHIFVLRGAPGADALEVRLAFAQQPVKPELPTWAHTRLSTANFWGDFWRRGGAVDFSGSTDPRAAELERRVVLSRYLTAIQFAGSVPPSETGLTTSSWYGKHNTEMVWWHVAHFASWGQDTYVENALDWYRRTLPAARALARERGLPGARWAKMVGPEGRESPGGNPLIIWNQPHVIYLAEMLYRNDPSPAVLHAWSDLVLESADCLSAMMAWDAAGDRYVLGPPLWISQEIYDQKKSRNPTFELSYWAFALKVAQQWRERLGLGRSADWDRRLAKISALPVKDGRYVALESFPDTWDNVASRHDHPSFLLALGMLPGDGVDRATMDRTLDAVIKSWDWETKIWGWDYPMMAMTAARLNEPQRAVDLLLKDGPNNHYLPNGHCPQRGDLAVYLPANGALLSAVALMAGGWDGAPARPTPGFPDDGRWRVRAEGLHPLP
jgi:hypothetical protein